MILPIRQDAVSTYCDRRAIVFFFAKRERRVMCYKYRERRSNGGLLTRTLCCVYMYRRTEWIVDKGCPKKNAARGAHSSRRRRVVDPRRAVARLLEDFSSNAGLSTRFFFSCCLCFVSFAWTDGIPSCLFWRKKWGSGVSISRTETYPWMLKWEVVSVFRKVLMLFNVFVQSCISVRTKLRPGVIATIPYNYLRIV